MINVMLEINLMAIHYHFIQLIQYFHNNTNMINLSRVNIILIQFSKDATNIFFAVQKC